MVELLKQPQFSPMSVGEQVITIFAGSSGLLDDVPVEAVGEFVNSFLRWLTREHNEYISEINTTNKLSDELIAKLSGEIKSYKSLRKSKV